MRRVVLVAIIMVASAASALAQCPSTDFSLAASACLNENIPVTNLSGAGTYEWDFCSGELNGAPTVTNPYTIAPANGRPGIDFATEGNTGIALLTGTFTNTLHRLTYYNGFAAGPDMTENLGNLGGVLDGPCAIRLVKESGNWFALVHNGTTGQYVKVSFGNSLSNTPTTSLILPGVAALAYFNGGFAVAKDDVASWVAVASTSSNQLAIMRLGGTLNVASPADVLVTPAVPNASNLGDIDLVRSCNSWFGFAANFGNGTIFRLKFGANLFQAPVIDEITTLPVNNPGRIRIVQEGDQYFLFITSLDGIFHKLKFGNDLNQAPVIVNEGNFGGTISSIYGLGTIKVNSTWTIAGVSLANGKIFSIDYPNICSASPPISSATNPLVRYQQAGVNNVSLRYTDALGIASAKTRTITVTSGVAPDIDFSIQNICAANNINFAAINSSNNLISYAWNFGDAGSATGPNPVHVYSAAGTYTASVLVGASNGCNNFASKALQVVNPPVANFNLPSASPVCTNQSYLLTNTSTFDVGSLPSWEWRVNGTLVSSQQNLTAFFNSPVAQDIRLKALLPGCENEIIKNIGSVTSGPAVNFTANDNCQGTAVAFTNTTSGTVDAGYSWSFGDATGSTLVSPTHTYAASGNFSVTLTGSNSAGCQNSQTKPLRIYSLPQPNFSVGLPPFSCSNSLTSFQNLTPGLSDSNITSWNWQFGDPANGTSNQPNPAYTYLAAGNFNVQLTAGTSAGCTASVTKPTTISASPTADFTVGPSCLSQSTKFTDVSSGGVQSRLWIIGSSTFGIPNPSYTFNTTGNFITTLTVTSVNGCTSVKNKTVTVPVPPVQNFSVSGPCERKNSVFTDATPTVPDGVVGWNWNFDGNSVTGNPASYAFPVQGTYNVKMTATYASGCKYTLAKDVVIKPTPIAAYTATPLSGPAPLTVQFENTSTQATSYLWKFYDKVTATSTHVSPVYTFTSLGDYSAELTASNTQGCSDVLTTPIHVVVPNIDLILSDFTLVKDGATGKLKPRVTIINNSNISFNLAEINLFLSGNAVVNETVTLNLNPGQSISQTLSFTLSPDQFDLQYLCAEINSEKDIQKDNNRRCINFSDGDYFFNPYPNPSPGVTHVDWVSNATGVAKVIVFDSMGKKAYEWETPSHAGLNQVVLDLEFLTSGFYYITVETSFSKKTSRFMRQ